MQNSYTVSTSGTVWADSKGSLTTNLLCDRVDDGRRNSGDAFGRRGANGR
jgi:hypothetical protein